MVRKITERFKLGEVAVISQDAYYRDNSNIPLEERQKINFDHPNAIEFELLIEHLKELKKGKTIPQPIYSYLSCTRAEEFVPVEPRKVVIVEGILVLTQPELRELFDIKVFVFTDDDERLIRVIQRDIIERGRTVEMVIERYNKSVKPMHLQFIEPSQRFADLIIPEGGANTVAIDVLSTVIEKKLNEV